MFSPKSTFTGCWVGGWISVGMAEDCLGLCLVIILFNYFFQIKEQTQLELRWKGAVRGDKLGHVQGVQHAVAEQVQHAVAEQVQHAAAAAETSATVLKTLETVTDHLTSYKVTLWHKSHTNISL